MKAVDQTRGGSAYSYEAKNYGRDKIYTTRLRIIEEKGFDYNKTPFRYSYFMEAYLGIILMQHK